MASTWLASLPSGLKARPADLDDHEDEHVYFVLTTALEEWAAGQRLTAEDEKDDSDCIEWAQTAERLLERIEAVGT